MDFSFHQRGDRWFIRSEPVEVGRLEEMLTLTGETHKVARKSKLPVIKQLGEALLLQVLYEQPETLDIEAIKAQARAEALAEVQASQAPDEAPQTPQAPDDERLAVVKARCNEINRHVAKLDRVKDAEQIAKLLAEGDTLGQEWNELERRTK